MAHRPEWAEEINALRTENQVLNEYGCCELLGSDPAAAGSSGVCCVLNRLGGVGVES